MPAWRHFFSIFPEELTATLNRLQQRPELLEEFVKGLLETEIEDALSDVIVARIIKGLQESRADLPAICTLAFVRGVQAESVSSGLLIEFSFDVLIDRIKMGTLPATCERMLQRRLSAFGFR